MKFQLRGIFLTSEDPARAARFYREVAQLGTLGIKAYATDDVVVTVEDPDGRKVMFGTA